MEEGEEINPETIEKLTSLTKEYSIFNLQDAMGKGDKAINTTRQVDESKCQMTVTL